MIRKRFGVWLSIACALLLLLPAAAAGQTGRECAHEWQSWRYYNDASHRKECQLCGAYEEEDHQIIPASSTISQHCAVCDAVSEEWPKAYGAVVEEVHEEVCTEPLQEEPEPAPAPTEIAQTISSFPVKDCDHQLTNWRFYNETYHMQICTRCAGFALRQHDLCEDSTGQHVMCTACNALYEGWQK